MSIAAFMVFFTVLFSNTAVSTNFLFGEQTVIEVHQAAVFYSDILVGFPGFPDGWSASTVRTIGLANDSGLIDAAKLDALAELPYNESLEKLHIRPFDFLLNITDIQGNSVYTYGALGNATHKISISRLVRLQNETITPAILTLVVWRDYQ